MTIEWLAGNRLRGTTAERPVSGLAAGSVGGWKELARHTRGSEGIMDVSSIPLSRYYMVLTNVNDTGGAGGNYRMFCNNDSGSNHAGRLSQNGTEYTEVSKTNGNYWGGNNIDEGFGVTYWTNLAAKEKLGISHFVDRNAVGAATAPMRSEAVMKWANTSTAINRFNSPSSWNLWDSGSEMVVLGWDPADSHTTNFWEELASVDLSGGSADVISSGVFTAKKYLWVQAYTNATGGNIITQMRVGNATIDTGSNYTFRYSDDGAADSVATSQSITVLTSGDNTMDRFCNLFIVNNAANEKLMIGNSVNSNTAGAGNAPLRAERVHKWTNTANQINIIDIINGGAGSFDTASTLKIWGSD